LLGLKGPAFRNEVSNIEVAEKTPVKNIDLTEENEDGKKSMTGEEIETVIKDTIKDTETKMIKTFVKEDGHKLDFFDNAINGHYGEEAQGCAMQVLDKLAEEETGLPVRMADDPIIAVARGTGILLEDLDLYKDVLWDKELES